MPKAGIALSVAMTCALIVTGVRLVWLHDWSWLSLCVGMAAPALAVLVVMLFLRIFSALDSPNNLIESASIALMHVLCAVTLSYGLAIAYPDLAGDPRFLVAFEWGQLNAWLPLLGAELALVPLAARG